MDPAIEFTVDGIVEGVSGFLHVVGRCGDSPIRVGDIFDSVYQYIYERQADQEIAKAKDIKRMCLKVEKIRAYERDLSMLGQGMTGRLSLSGTGAELVGLQCVLGTPVRASTNGVVQQTSKSVAST